MKTMCAAICLLVLLHGVPAAAQTTPGPTLIPLSGSARTVSGEPRTGQISLRLALYASEEHPDPLWIEDQLITLGADGAYKSGWGRLWRTACRPTFFSTTPYAARATSADTLGTKTAAEFVLSENLRQILERWGFAGSSAPLTPRIPGINSLHDGELSKTTKRRPFC